MGVKVRSSKGKLFLDINWKGRRWWEATHLDAGVVASHIKLNEPA
jgi:hypothetical protein